MCNITIIGPKGRGLDSEFNPVKGASMMDLDGEDANMDGGSDMEGDGDGETSSQGMADKKEEKKEGDIQRFSGNVTDATTSFLVTFPYPLLCGLIRIDYQPVSSHDFLSSILKVKIM